MTPTLKLADLISKGEAALAASSTLLAQKLFVLDGTGVERITDTQLDALLTALPSDWSFPDLNEVIDMESLTPGVAEQLRRWVLRRKFESAIPTSTPDTLEAPEISLAASSSTVPSPTVLIRALHPLRALDRVIDEYRDYLRTEFHAKDPDLKAALERELETPLFLAQEPFFQAHRPFKAGQRWRDLPLDARLSQVMEHRAGPYAYLHQSAAIENLLGSQARPIVVTTGTGSGKTEAFLLPVIQNAIDDASTLKRPGLTAILVYPMNALANDQLERIEMYLQDSGWSGAISVAKYDRGTTQAERQELRKHPPHILLTNYMMLEYLLVRPADREDIFTNHRCRFLVLDEVHTYRGTLGSNIALLMRRLQAHLARARQDWRTNVSDAERARRFPTLIPIGTSATIKSVTEDDHTPEERMRLRDVAVQEFFSKLTGVTPDSILVLGEQLEEISPPPEGFYPLQTGHVDIAQLDVADVAAVKRALCILSGQPLDTPLNEATHHYRILWDLNRMLTGMALSLSQVAERIQAEVPERTSTPPADLQAEVTAALVIAAALPDDTPGALRLRTHRLLRGGWQFHRCVNPTCGKLYAKGEDQCPACNHRTAPLYLCRNCGADYLRFVGDDPKDPSNGPLRPSTATGDGAEWMFYVHQRFETEMGSDEDEDVAEDSDSTPNGRSSSRIHQQMRGRPVVRGSFDPATCMFSPNEDDYALPATLAPARTRCLCCGGTVGSRNILTPVALGTSAAVKVMAEGLVGALADIHRGQAHHDGKERLLVFSDSRQDAAHQARFINFATRYDRMRRRVVQILKEYGPLSLQRTVELLGELGVRERDNPHIEGLRSTFIPDETRRRIQVWEEAPLLDEIALNAGYRATLINLGLVRVAYHQLDEYIQSKGASSADKLGITLEQLEYLCRCMLDEMRVRGCLTRDLLRSHPLHPSCPSHLRAAEWERRVKQPQGYPLGTDGLPRAYLEPGGAPSGIKVHNAWRRPRRGGRGSALERVLNHLLKRFGGVVPDETQMVGLLDFLLCGGFLNAASVYGAREKTVLLQVNADVIWFHPVIEDERVHCVVCSLSLPGAQKGEPCPRCHGTMTSWPDSEVQANRTVKYIHTPDVVLLEAREHTAQVPNAVRLETEEQFKAPAHESRVNLLACSPTLEMGIDVGGLDAIILRNVPPRPDNYAQRAGRAGRRTRVGLVLGYARNTPHDQYFYDKPAEMIAGAVPAPALALGNRDVILRHLGAIAFGGAEPGLAGKMVEYVSPQGQIKQETVDALIAGVRAQTSHALELAHTAWGNELLAAADLDDAALREYLDDLPRRIQEVFARTARQVQELRTALDTYASELQGARAGTRAGELVARLLGIETERRRTAGEADDRSAGYPLRRFAEFGILPGYEFPTEPAALRLLGDDHEEDPITVGRRFGIAQFQPDAQVYARAKRWKVIGLDTSSPWNPRTDGPSWVYRRCKSCDLHYDATEPRCPRCQTEKPGPALPAAAYAGFVARRDESPILDEEDRYATRNRVIAHPQWDGIVAGRWTASPGWALRWSRNETVRWLNEGPPPTTAELREGIPLLHPEATGYALCGACGRMLEFVPSMPDNRTSKKKANSAFKGRDLFGHADGCSQRGAPPQLTAIVADGSAEILRLVVPVPVSMPAANVQSWGLSLGYALRAGMRHQYTLDGSEIEFELEGPWAVETDGMRYARVALTFIDPSVGGSGYVPRIATEFNLIARQAIEHLDHPGCETACYRCLKTYQNQRYHDLLNWPRIIADLEALAQEAPAYQPAALSDLDDPYPWLEAYAAGVGSPLELQFLRLFERYGLHPQKQIPVSPDDGPAISIADFAVPEQRLAIYVDGAIFHTGENRRRDRFIRDRLRNGKPPWTVVELRAADLREEGALVRRLKSQE